MFWYKSSGRYDEEPAHSQDIQGDSGDEKSREVVPKREPTASKEDLQGDSRDEKSREFVPKREPTASKEATVDHRLKPARAPPQRQLRRRNSCPPASNAHLKRRHTMVLEDSSDASFSRAVYSHAREYLATTRRKDGEGSRIRAAQLFSAIRYATRAVLLSGSAIRFWLREVSKQKMLREADAEEYWNSLCRFLDTKDGGDETEADVSFAERLARILRELLKDVRDGEGLHQRAMDVILSLKRGDESLRRLHASYALYASGYSEVKTTIDQCLRDAMRLMGAFESNVAEMRRALESLRGVETARTPGTELNVNAAFSEGDQRQSGGGVVARLVDGQSKSASAGVFHNLHSSSEAGLANPAVACDLEAYCRVVATHMEKRSKFEDSAAQSELWMNLSNVLCDGPLKVMQTISNEIMSEHKAMGMPDLPSLLEDGEESDEDEQIAIPEVFDIHANDSRRLRQKSLRQSFKSGLKPSLFEPLPSSSFKFMRYCTERRPVQHQIVGPVKKVLRRHSLPDVTRGEGVQERHVPEVDMDFSMAWSKLSSLQHERNDVPCVSNLASATSAASIEEDGPAARLAARVCAVTMPLSTNDAAASHSEREHSRERFGNNFAVRERYAMSCTTVTPLGSGVCQGFSKCPREVGRKALRESGLQLPGLLSSSRPHQSLPGNTSSYLAGHTTSTTNLRSLLGKGSPIQCKILERNGSTSMFLKPDAIVVDCRSTIKSPICSAPPNSFGCILSSTRTSSRVLLGRTSTRLLKSSSRHHGTVAAFEPFSFTVTGVPLNKQLTCPSELRKQHE